MPDTSKYNEWFTSAVETLGYEKETILEDIMIVHDLEPEQDFKGYIRQLCEKGYDIVFRDEDEVWEWLLEYGHI